MAVNTTDIVSPIILCQLIYFINSSNCELPVPPAGHSMVYEEKWECISARAVRKK